MAFNPIKIFGSSLPGKTQGDTIAVTSYSKKFEGPDRSGRFSVHIGWTGTLNGDLQLWYTNVPKPLETDDTEWVQDTTFTASDPAGSAGMTFVTVGNLVARWVRIKFARTSGSGDIWAWAVVSE